MLTAERQERTFKVKFKYSGLVDAGPSVSRESLMRGQSVIWPENRTDVRLDQTGQDQPGGLVSFPQGFEEMPQGVLSLSLLRTRISCLGLCVCVNETFLPFLRALRAEIYKSAHGSRRRTFLSFLCVQGRAKKTKNFSFRLVPERRRWYKATF